MFLPEGCTEDHGRLRSCFSNGLLFPLLFDLTNGSHEHGNCASRGGLNPDGFWQLRGAPVLIKVGCKQSLSVLRSRAYDLNMDASKPGRTLVICLRRYRAARRLYMEVWSCNPALALVPIPNFQGTSRQPPAALQVLPAGMTHFGSVHVTNCAAPPASLAWQAAFGNAVVLPAAAFGGGAAATAVELNDFIARCDFVGA